MATRTYTVGDQSGVRRLDNLTGPWIDVPLNLSTCKNVPILDILRDVMTDPNDENKVFVCGWRNASDCRPGIYWSNDAGVTWNKAIGDVATSFPNATDNVWEIWAVDSNVIYATSNYGYCYKSVDGGITFNHTAGTPTLIGFPAPNVEYTSRAIHFPDATNGVLSQDVGTNQYVMITADGGATWGEFHLTGVFGAMGNILGIHMSADYQTINVLSENGVFRSTDGGASYSQTYGVADFDKLIHLTWVGDNDLWGYGREGLRIRSTDGGATWNTINPATASAPDCKAGHHYQLPEGFFSEDASILRTFNESVSGTLSEVSPYGVEAVWTLVPNGISPPNPDPCGCPEGYTYNQATNECDQILSVPPICDPTTYTVNKASTNAQYGQMGTNFFADTSNSVLPLTHIVAVGGLGGMQDATLAPLPYVNVNAASNNFWGNCNPFNPYAFPCTGSATSGRLNAVGVWAMANGDPHGEWIGFTTCVNVPTTGVYFIGIGSDESSRFKIDGVLFTNLFPGSFDEWSVWRVFPVTLTAGQHVIEMEGRNNTGPGAFGAEIYKVPNDDVNLLMAVTSDAELAPYLIWSTLDLVGEVFDLGEDSGCECPDGYALSNCNGFLECVQTNTVPFEPCNCYEITNCDDPNDTLIIQTDPMDPPLDPTKTYVFGAIDPDKCWSVITSVDCDPADPQPYTVVTETFDSCEECTKICYELTDCEALLTPIQTDTDLSAYVGQVITIASCPETCWVVTELPDCPIDPASVSLVSAYPDCVTCLPSDPPPPPLVIKNRTVKPGYNTKGCSPAYVEKISCAFSEAMFQQAASRRYGIEFCCGQDLDELDIKKQLMDFQMITDPEACVSSSSLCCAPCNVVASLVTFNPLSCPAPTGVAAILIPPPVVIGKDCRNVRFSPGEGPDDVPQVFTGTLCTGAEIIVSLLPGQSGVTWCVDASLPFTKDPALIATVIGTC